MEFAEIMKIQTHYIVLLKKDRRFFFPRGASKRLHIYKVSETYVLTMLRICGSNSKHACCKNIT